MSAGYKAIIWNRQKKIYDGTIASAIVLYLGLFAGVGAIVYPSATAETLLIRGLGTCAFLMLHVILAIGPLARLDSRFLPLLYNRRHLGVGMFLVALSHGAFSLVQFHALGDTPALVNQEPYGQGWMILVEPSDASALEQLLDADAYQAFTEKESGATY